MNKEKRSRFLKADVGKKMLAIFVLLSMVIPVVPGLAIGVQKGDQAASIQKNDSSLASTLVTDKEPENNIPVIENMLSGNTIYVPNDYPTIQAAIDAASSGDTIFVFSGIYYEHLTINKQVILTGEDRNTTIIDGNGSGDVVIVNVDYVQIHGFTIQRSGDGVGSRYYYSGIRLRSNNNIISGNIPTNNRGSGIRLEGSSSSIITDNTITDNRAGGIVLDNTCSFNTFTHNTITNNQADGISLGENVYYTNNCFSNTITGNTITNYRGYGIGLQHSSFNTITDNTIISNLGIFGICLQTDTHSNIIYHNTIINPNPVCDEGSNNTWYIATRCEGNYWSNYQGVDINQDGIGDMAYWINGPTNNYDSYPLMHPFKLGDMNLDGQVTFADIDPWVMALSNPVAYQAQYHIRATLHGDINQDARITFADIDPFVALLGS